tara:strand:+ start:157 stop:654 length:498 start_codon:yes stop_codon:yes gene_type:complete
MRKKVYSSEILNVFEKKIENKKRIITLNSSNWVNIIPITNQNQIVFVKQFRYGSNSETLEIPGGMVDNNESSFQAASRELYEETGYTCEKIIALGNISPNPALFRNRVSSFLGLNAKLKNQIINNEEEINECILINKEEIPSLIKSGKIDHALVISAFHLLEIKE